MSNEKQTSEQMYWAKQRTNLYEIGGWDNELVSVPAGGVRKLIESGESQATRIAELEQEKADEQASFDLRWKADMRAIKRWQAEQPGRELTWPDHADLCVWLLERIPNKATEDVIDERARQKTVEGWDEKHDDEQEVDGALATAAACYAWAASCHPHHPDAVPIEWPWDVKWWKPKDRRRDLVRAGALIIAEIERLDRKEGM